MKHHPTEHGATLIIILIIILAIMSITAVGFEISMLEFKNATRLQTRIIDFYRAENCLHQAIQEIYSAKQPLPHSTNCGYQICANDYSLLDFTKLSVSWWDAHRYVCAKNIWSYTQLLAEGVDDNRYFYRITVYAYPHDILQATIGKSFNRLAPTIISWRQLNI